MARALQGGCRGVLSLYFHCPAPTDIWGLAHDAHTGWFGGLERQWRHPLWRRSTRGSRGCYSCAGCRQLCGVVPRSAVIAGAWLVFDPRRAFSPRSKTTTQSKGFQCAAGDFLGAQTPIAGHIRAIRPLLLVGRGRPAVNRERAPTGINRPPVRPKAKRLPSTGLANTGRRPRLTLDRRTGQRGLL